MEIFSPPYSTLVNMFNTELDMCKQLYNEHVKQVSGGKVEHIHNIILCVMPII
jgi:dynein heavy chain